MTTEDEIRAGAETPKYREFTTKYLIGCGLDIGSGGFSPVVPNAITVEQPIDDFLKYTGGRHPAFPIHLHCGGLNLPFKDGTLDFIYASHVIEDWSRETTWMQAFMMWHRILKPGGHLVLLVPEFERWNDAIRRGQPPNCAHWAPEPKLGDMSKFAVAADYVVVEERLTNLTEFDYTILGVFMKP